MLRTSHGALLGPNSGSRDSAGLGKSLAVACVLRAIVTGCMFIQKFFFVLGVPQRRAFTVESQIVDGNRSLGQEEGIGTPRHSSTDLPDESAFFPRSGSRRKASELVGDPKSAGR